MKVLEKFSALIFRIKSASIEGERQTKNLASILHILWSFALKILYIVVIRFSRVCQFRSRSINTFAFLADPSSGMVTAANTNQGEPRTCSWGNLSRGLLQDQAFQRLIDWSSAKQVVIFCAVISGPNGFYTNHRLKASEDFPG